MAEVTLKTGERVLVDDDDLHLVEGIKWYRHSQGYATGYIPVSFRGAADGRLVLMHEFIIGVKWLDHENGNRLDNRRQNLRPADRFKNARNVAVRKCESKTSKFKGVCWDKQKLRWKARLNINGKQVHGGFHADETAAALAYNELAKIHFGEFSRFNTI